MTHVDPEILALLAVDGGAGAEPEREHVAQCAECQAELASLAEVVARARRANLDPEFTLTQPPPEVWARITSELAAPQQTAPAPAGPARRPWWRTPVAVALAGLLIGGGAAIAAEQLARHQPAASTVVASVTLHPLPQFPQWRAASGTAELQQTSAGRKLTVRLDASKLSAGQGFFEVWLLGQDGVKMISLGDLDSGRTGQFTLPPGVDLAYYSRIDISLQPFDGSTLHSKVSVVRGSFPGRQ